MPERGAEILGRLSTSWVRNAILACVIVGTGASAGALILGEVGLWDLAFVCGSIVVVSGIESRFGRVRPSTQVLTAAGATVVISTWADPLILPSIVAGTLLAGVVVISVFERPARGLVSIAGLISVLGIAMWISQPGAASIFAFGPMGSAGLLSWLLVTGITRSLQDRESEATRQDLEYRALFDRVPVGLYRTGLDGSVLDGNHALGELLGLSRDDLIGRQVRSFLADPDDLDRLRGNIGSEPLVTDLRMSRKDGTVIWVRDRTRAVRDESGVVMFYEGELQDITDQVNHVAELESLVQSKSELIAAVSHELRTPLTAVVGFLDVLANGGSSDNEDMLQMATEQAHEVAAIVDDLLTAARLENRELVVKVEEVDMVEAARSAVRSLDDDHVLLSMPTSLVGMGDATRVRQILRNLVGNALRYGAPPVEVRGKAGDGRVKVVVGDKGKQIPPDIAGRMFEPFYTTGVGDSQPGAIGLGLAVSRQLARRMGGDLVYTRVGNETRFTLELPAASSQDRAA